MSNAGVDENKKILFTDHRHIAIGDLSWRGRASGAAGGRVVCAGVGVRSSGCAPSVRLCRLGLGAAVARGGALAIRRTKLRARSIEERSLGHGTGGLRVEFGDSEITEI